MYSYDEQYMAIGTQSYPAGQGEVFLWDYTKDNFQLIQETQLHVLRLTDRFRTLKAHRNELIETGWQDDGSGSIEGMLEDLVQRGLLRPKRAFIDKLTDVSAPEGDRAPISSFGWVTRDRPILLKRSVESFIDNCVENDRKVEYKILDDSPDEKTRIEIRSLLAELSTSKGVTILYAGEEEKREYADQILRKAAPEKLPIEVLEFALFDSFGIGYTTGANRNWFLLGTAGELCLMIDDDVVSRFCRSYKSEEGLALGSSPDPTQFQFFSDRTDLLQNVDFHELCIPECHERLLGQSLSECLRNAMASGAVDLSKLTPEDLRHLDANPGKVVVTMTGVCGDSGMGSPRMLLGLAGENREALLESEEHYRSPLVSREVMRVVTRPTVGYGGLLMMMNCGFDNRALLPPFFPVLRGSDGIFSQTLRTCQPENLIGYLPVACFHDPQEQRASYPEEVTASSIRMADLLILLVRSFRESNNPGQGEDNLKKLGQYFVQIGESDASRFVENLRTLWIAEMSRYIEYLEYLLLRHNYQPTYWAEDVAKYIEAIKARATSTTLLVDDLFIAGDEAKGKKLCQELVTAFGRLLYWWPLIWETSKSVQSEEAPLFAQV